MSCFLVISLEDLVDVCNLRFAPANPANLSPSFSSHNSKNRILTRNFKVCLCLQETVRLQGRAMGFVGEPDGSDNVAICSDSVVIG